MTLQILTKREKDCLDFVVTFLKRKGHSPQIRDIMVALDLTSTASPSFYIKRLEEKGYLTRGGKKQLVSSIEVSSTGRVKVYKSRGARWEVKVYTYTCSDCAAEIKIRSSGILKADILLREKKWSITRRSPNGKKKVEKTAIRCPRHKR